MGKILVGFIPVEIEFEGLEKFLGIAFDPGFMLLYVIGRTSLLCVALTALPGPCLGCDQVAVTNFRESSAFASLCRQSCKNQMLLRERLVNGGVPYCPYTVNVTRFLHRKGLSQSALPYRRSVPTWLKLTSDDVKEQIYKLAKKGLTPSQIGVILRDSHGVAQVRFVTGNKILRILKSKGLAPDLPEDLYHLIKKAVAVRKHLERNRKDKDAKFRLILIESRIHRLARYYKTKRVLPPNWKYESSTASALVA
nr:PREDICTED: 40S ribosomal protein S13 [Struthio camelus australis]